MTQVPNLKIRNFHFSLAALQVPECIVHLERFPGLAVRAISPDSNDSECTHCRLDKYIPKLYSSANNMDPGPLPSELYTDTYSLLSLYSLLMYRVLHFYYTYHTHHILASLN